jgi:hypothetical protein
MSDYNLLLQPMSEFCLSSTCFTVFILGPVTTGFLRFFAVPVRGSWIMKLSGTNLVCGPSKKGNRTETRPDFKALWTSHDNFPTGHGLAQAEPEPAQAYQHGSGFSFGRPSLTGGFQAEPSRHNTRCSESPYPARKVPCDEVTSHFRLLVRTRIWPGRGPGHTGSSKFYQ